MSHEDCVEKGGAVEDNPRDRERVFPEEERLENKRTGKGATSSCIALGCLRFRLFSP